MYYAKRRRDRPLACPHETRCYIFSAPINIFQFCKGLIVFENEERSGGEY